jgi:hypothetical protein
MNPNQQQIRDKFTQLFDVFRNNQSAIDDLMSSDDLRRRVAAQRIDVYQRQMTDIAVEIQKLTGV